MSNWNFVIAAHVVTWVTLALYYRSIVNRRKRASAAEKQP